METAIRWSANSSLSEQHFLLADVTGRSFKHANVTSYDGKSLQYDLISTYTKVPPFRAFDWAPFDEALVAVGQWSGEATILRIDDSAAPVSLITKHQRLCNAVTFSNAGLLATGLERVRNVECLNLWDVNQRLSSVSSPSGRGGKAFEPYRKFSSSGAISSIKFSIRQPEILIAGVKGFGIRIYDLRDNSGNASSQFSTSCVHNVAIDPLNENYFACCATGKDTTIQIWDCRSGSPNTGSVFGASGDTANQIGPTVEYTEAFTAPKDLSQPNTWSSRFCKGKSGFLGALASNGEFKVYETTIGFSRVVSDSETQITSNGLTTERLLTKRVHKIERAFDDVHQSRQESERIVAFDFTNLAGAKGTPSAILLRGNGSVSIQELSGEPTAFSIGALGALSVGRQYNRATSTILDGQNTGEFSDLITTYLKKEESPDAAPSDETGVTSIHETYLLDSKSRSNAKSDRSTFLSSREAHERAADLQSRAATIEGVLESITKSQRRSIAGYSLDAGENIRLLGDDPWLQIMWRWIERAEKSAKNGSMIGGGLDLNYLGVFDVWRSDLTSDQVQRRRSSSESAPDVNDAILMLAESLEKIFPEWKIDSQEYRLVCLHICGLALSPQEVEITVRDLISNNEKTKAAALAIIHNNGMLALQALRAGPVSALDRELSLALAGYLNGLIDNINGTWHETIEVLAANLMDPYARAILAFVSHGNWRDVLQETSLPLRDRISIALMYLSDNELDKYINVTTEEAIEAGDVEGIVLTGLGSKSVSLFENYIRKFSDLQTAVLALAFASPRYFSDPRVTVWRQTYRRQLDDLGMFPQRAHFDVQHSRLSISPDGTSTLSRPARQISIRCTYCEQSLDRNLDHDAPAANPKATNGVHKGSIFGLAGKSGTFCPKCGRHMPRCVICLHWVGMPDPHTKGTVAQDTAKHDAMDSFINVCRACWHVTHARHAEGWFRQHSVCPASGCDCHCVEVDVSVG